VLRVAELVAVKVLPLQEQLASLRARFSIYMLVVKDLELLAAITAALMAVLVD
jgi:hypothetical protein